MRVCQLLALSSSLLKVSRLFAYCFSLFVVMFHGQLLVQANKLAMISSQVNTRPGDVCRILEFDLLVMMLT